MFTHSLAERNNHAELCYVQFCQARVGCHAGIMVFCAQASHSAHLTTLSWGWIGLLNSVRNHFLFIYIYIYMYKNTVHHSLLVVFYTLVLNCNFLFTYQVMQQPTKKCYVFGLTSSIQRAFKNI